MRVGRASGRYDQQKGSVLRLKPPTAPGAPGSAELHY
jgi:hypothetical protein